MSGRGGGGFSVWISVWEGREIEFWGKVGKVIRESNILLSDDFHTCELSFSTQWYDTSYPLVW